MSISVDTIADLKALNPAGVASNHVVVLGYDNPGDEGGGIFCWVPGALDKANIGTVIASTFTPLPAGRWKRVFAGPVDVHWFGAKGKSAANDTPAIQAALDAHSHVVLRRGCTYTLKRSDSESFAGHPVCLILNSFQVLDGQGGTLRLADNEKPAEPEDGEDAIMLINRRALDTGAQVNAGSATTGIRIRNLEIDGNGWKQRQAFRVRPTVYFTGPSGYTGPIQSVEEVEVENVRIRNSYVFAFYADNMQRFVLRNVWVKDANGDGLHIFAREGFMDELHVDTTTQLDTENAVGACHVYDLQDVQIGRLTAVNCWWAYKFQGTTRNLSIGSIVFRGGPKTTEANKKAVKFQGIPGQSIKNINVGSIEVYDAATTGLYLFHVENLNIGRYIGSHNGFDESELKKDLTLGVKDQSDILVLEGVGSIRFGQVAIEHSAAVAIFIDGGQARGQYDLDFGQVFILAPAISAVAVRRTSARIRFESLALHVDNVPSDAAYISIARNCDFQVGQYSTNIPIASGKLAVKVNGTEAVVQIDRVMFGNLHAPHGFLTLADGTTSTVVSNDNVMIFAGTGQGDGVVRPVVEVMPFTDQAAALGTMRVEPNDSTSAAGGGFSLHHALAGINCIVAYRVTGYANFEPAPPDPDPEIHLNLVLRVFRYVINALQRLFRPRRSWGR